MDEEVDDSEVINVMVNGAMRVCDHAVECHISGKYGKDPQQIQRYVKKWEKIRSRVQELAKKWKVE